MNIGTLEEYFDRLWDLPRSITGHGFEKSLDVLSEIIPFKKRVWLSGENVHDWIVPDEWNFYGAKIWKKSDSINEDDDIVNSNNSNLHVVGYSEPTSGELPWKELREYVHTIPKLPDAIPYITSYYKRRWGFCMSHNQYLELEKEPDTVYGYYIDSSLGPGKLIAGDCIIPGEVEDEIMISSYLCHPSLANNELSGPLALLGIYEALKDSKPHYTLRFYIGPENIGMICYLDRFGFHLKDRLKAGLIVHCVGLGPEVTYKQTRQGSTIVDRAVLNTLPRLYLREVVEVVPFFPDGSDERQLCSPGYNLPVGSFMRKGPWDYKEYHTSLDNKDLINFDTILESIDMVVDIINTVDKNRTYKGTVQLGTPMFAKHPEGEKLYQSTMKLNSFFKGEGHRQVMLEILNWSDGKHDLLWIADRYNRRMLDLLPVVEMLLGAGYLECVH